MYRRMEDHEKALPLFQQAIALHKAAVAAKGGEAKVGPMDAMGAYVCACVRTKCRQFARVYYVYCMCVCLIVCLCSGGLNNFPNTHTRIYPSAP